jgi:hypothetical protein
MLSHHIKSVGLASVHASSQRGSVDQASLRTRAFQPGGLSSVAFGNDRFVALSSSRSVLLSADGLRWFSQALPPNLSLGKVRFCDDVFIAVGGGGTIASSSNGVSWTRGIFDRPPLSSSMALQDVTSGAGRCVAVGIGGGALTGSVGIVLTSTNALNWAAQPAPGLTSIAFGNGQFVATGGDKVLVSKDAENWTVLGVSASQVAFGNGLFVISNPIRTSPDGFHWTTQSVSAFFGPVAFAGGEFVGFGNNQFMLSRDARIWTLINLPLSSFGVVAGAEVAYGNGRFVAAGGRSTYASDDGANWVSVGPPGSTFGGNRVIAWAGGQFVAVGNLGLVAASTDALFWTAPRQSRRTD